MDVVGIIFLGVVGLALVLIGVIAHRISKGSEVKPHDDSATGDDRYYTDQAPYDYR